MKFDRQKIHAKYNGACGYCGIPIAIKDMQVDHIIPQREYFFFVRNKHKIPPFLIHLTEWDCHHLDNLMPACRVCNNWKSAHHLELFRKELSEQLNRLNERSSNYRIARKYNLIEETPKPIVFYFETLSQQT